MYKSPLQGLQTSEKRRFDPSNAPVRTPISGFDGHYSHFLLPTRLQHFQCASQTTLAHVKVPSKVSKLRKNVIFDPSDAHVHTPYSVFRGHYSHFLFPNHSGHFQYAS